MPAQGRASVNDASNAAQQQKQSSSSFPKTHSRSFGSPDPNMSSKEKNDFHSGKVVPREYPLYKQCDPRWGDHLIYNETVCAVGCLMSSVSMSIGGFNISIDGQISDPGTLNEWLKEHGGYTEENDLKESVVPNVDPEHIEWVGKILDPSQVTPKDLVAHLNNPSTVMIGNVMHGRHFVLIIGYDTNNETRFYVNDPGFDTAYYEYSDFVGYRVFSLSSPQHG
jgi:hypothetical protein